MKWFSILSISALMTSCSSTEEKPKNPDDRTSVDAPIPSKKMARKHDASWPDISLGHAVYMRKCGECHEHLLPDEIKSDNWHVYVPKMAWRAGISPEEQQALLAYLEVAAKEKP
ncbi:cytochrome c [Akkermansiaceae bacterium]|nr:cytochrome c [Akkermansiaceae bacterium]